METFDHYLLARKEFDPQPHAARRRRKEMLMATLPLAVLWLDEREQEMIDEFRQWVGTRLGLLGVAVFDSRLDGDDSHSLAGDIGLGAPTAHAIKKLTRRIDLLAIEFALAKGMPPNFLVKIEAALTRRRAKGN